MSYGITLSFPSELLSGVHDFSADVFKMALYTEELDQSAAAYTATNELSGGSYVAGGNDIALTLASSGNSTTVSVAQEEFSIPTGTTAMMIYNSSKSNKSVFVSRTPFVPSGGTLTVLFNSPLLSFTV